MEAAQALGTLVKGAAGMEAGKYNRDVHNAQAAEELQLGNAEELRIRDAARLQMGLQVASQAESGFVPGAGSNLRSLEESAINAELDRMNVRRAAQGRAAGLRAQAKMARNEGRMAMSAAMYQAGTDVAIAQRDRSASDAIRKSKGNYGD